MVNQQLDILTVVLGTSVSHRVWVSGLVCVSTNFNDQVNLAATVIFPNVV